MITEISIENYLSIKEKVVFSLDSTPSKNLEQNLIKLQNKNILKTAVIYGANASGKSNLIKSVFYIWFLVKNSHLFNIETKLNKINPARTPFKLDSSCLNKPSKFEILFIHEDIKYKYGFSCDNEGIIEEYLYHSPKGRGALIFSRTDYTKFKFTEDKAQQDIITKQMNKNVLYLSRATQLGYHKTRFAYEFIINNIVINPNRSDLTIREIYENKKSKNKFLEVLRRADFGGILDLEVSKEKRKVDGSEFKFENKVASMNQLKDKEEDFFDVKFVHENENKELIRLSPQEESSGTRKTLEMLGPIFDVLRNGKTAFIDEFELNLHPNITEFLIKLFHSKHNTKNGQLVITTHDTTLLKNKNLFRRDQVYICSKAPNKWTEINSLIDFDLRESLSFENAYLNGRVGGLPFIDNSFFED